MAALDKFQLIKRDFVSIEAVGNNTDDFSISPSFKEFVLKREKSALKL